jgi:membrane-anchored protein YejM (alkaline phosphatase superfamily)
MLLKKMGYEIHLHSASRLGLYEMDKMVFGRNMYLLNSANCYASDEHILPWMADERAINGLCDQLQEGEQQGGRVFIVFLDSTHFDYSFPEEFNTRYAPVDDKINYFDVAVSKKNLEKVKNRYKTAINYVDTLFAKFIDTLKVSGGWEESVVVFTGDHGEEFYENGHLFHATDLSQQQLHVPLYL